MDKWEKWYESLPEHTKRYLQNQPVWYDIDLAKAAAFGFVVGLLFGLCF
jgi:hypothetical protein